MPRTTQAAKDESNRARFVRLAEARTARVLDGLHGLGQLADPKRYEYTDADVSTIFGAIETRVSEAREALTRREVKKPGAFHLSTEGTSATTNGDTP